MYRETFVINQLPDSPNVSTNKKNHWARDKNRKAWDKLIYLLTRNRLPEQPLSKYHLRLVRYATRFMDCDNLTASFKDVVDSFVTARVLENDRWENSGKWDVDQEKCPANEKRISITITERPNPNPCKNH